MSGNTNKPRHKHETSLKSQKDYIFLWAICPRRPSLLSSSFFFPRTVSLTHVLPSLPFILPSSVESWLFVARGVRRPKGGNPPAQKGKTQSDHSCFLPFPTMAEAEAVKVLPGLERDPPFFPNFLNYFWSFWRMLANPKELELASQSVSEPPLSPLIYCGWSKYPPTSNIVCFGQINRVFLLSHCR